MCCSCWKDIFGPLVQPVVDLVKYIWRFLSKHAGYICNLQENLRSLEVGIAKLRTIKEGVDGRVQRAEAQQMARKPEVRDWLDGFRRTNGRVTQVLQQGNRELEDRCSSCCPKLNCCRSYNLGKQVVELIVDVQRLTNEASAPEFQEVADTTRTIAVQGIPENAMEGGEDTKSDLDRALHMLEDVKVSFIGIHGMGGVGKTTLLDKINNHFLRGNGECKVIYVVVSRALNLGRIQQEIGKRLGFEWEGDALEEGRRHIIFNMLSTMKFLLLLDDCWEAVNLGAIGIPSPHQCQNKVKVVFTTRSIEVCGLMGAQETSIRVRCLNEDDAWQLFQREAGRETLNSNQEIGELARSVARECCGLPLALVTIGRTMSSKKTAPEWRNCLRVLQNSAAGASEPSVTEVTEMQIYAKLKFSYDELRDSHKLCFLYCSLFPEDFNIHKDVLIKHWIGEGFLDGFENMDEAHDMGYGVVETLKAVGLLESGLINSDIQVKMHDMMRDLAIWIGRECGNRVNKILVQSGAHLSEAPLTPQRCSEVERISLMRTSIWQLNDPPTTCTNLLTLLLEENSQLCYISPRFFEFTPALKVLNLSCTGVRFLPSSISHLVNLRYLDLSFSHIEALTGELGKLVGLKYLDLSHTRRLTIIPPGLVSCLLMKLQTLNLQGSRFEIWYIEEIVGGNNVRASGAGVRLMALQQLRIALGLTVSSNMALQKLLVFENNLQVSITNLVITTCHDLVSLKVAPSSSNTATTSLASTSAIANSSGLSGMKNLQTLEIRDCSSLKELTITWTSIGFKRFESLTCSSLPKFAKLTIQCERRMNTPQYYPGLRLVAIADCHSLEDLTWVIFLPNLSMIAVANCKELKRIVSDGASDVNALSSLKTLELTSLPKLESIHENALPFPHLETITVYDCPLLRKLPLSNDSARNTLRSIWGGDNWWDNLQWEDELKSSLERYFNTRIIR